MRKNLLLKLLSVMLVLFVVTSCNEDEGEVTGALKRISLITTTWATGSSAHSWEYDDLGRLIENVLEVTESGLQSSSRETHSYQGNLMTIEQEQSFGGNTAQSNRSL